MGEIAKNTSLWYSRVLGHSPEFGSTPQCNGRIPYLSKPFTDGRAHGVYISTLFACSPYFLQQRPFRDNRRLFFRRRSRKAHESDWLSHRRQLPCPADRPRRPISGAFLSHRYATATPKPLTGVSSTGMNGPLSKDHNNSRMIMAIENTRSPSRILVIHKSVMQHTAKSAHPGGTSGRSTGKATSVRR